MEETKSPTQEQASAIEAEEKAEEANSSNNQNMLYALVGVIVVLLLVIGYMFIQDSDNDGVEISATGDEIATTVPTQEEIVVEEPTSVPTVEIEPSPTNEPEPTVTPTPEFVRETVEFEAVVSGGVPAEFADFKLNFDLYNGFTFENTEPNTNRTIIKSENLEILISIETDSAGSAYEKSVPFNQKVNTSQFGEIYVWEHVDEYNETDYKLFVFGEDFWVGEDCAFQSSSTLACSLPGLSLKNEDGNDSLVGITCKFSDPEVVDLDKCLNVIQTLELNKLT